LPLRPSYFLAQIGTVSAAGSSLTVGKFAPTALAGTIAPDGTYTSTGGRITGKFEGNSFSGGFSVPNGYCNPYKITMDRS
jgi:hypothetical protein